MRGGIAKSFVKRKEVYDESLGLAKPADSYPAARAELINGVSQSSV
jgi:hypothetical protein